MFEPSEDDYRRQACYSKLQPRSQGHSSPTPEGTSQESASSGGGEMKDPGNEVAHVFVSYRPANLCAICICCSIRMALKSRFALFALFALLLLPYQCEVGVENCSETQCLLLPDGDDPVASEFHFKASEKGVRLVYINLGIAGASYDPLELPDVFLPHRWVWANTIREPMLSLPDDYDILSLGLLNHQVRSIDVKLKDQPSGCLAKLNSTCQNLAVGRMLLANVTSNISGEILQEKMPVVCVALINRTFGNVKYHCCDMHKEATEPATIRCDQSVDNSDWNAVVLAVFCLTAIFLTLYCPALPLALPDYVFSLENEVEKENRLAEQTNRETTGDERIANSDRDGGQDNQRGTGADRWNTQTAVLIPTATTTAVDRTTNSNNNTNREQTFLNTSNRLGNSRERGEESEFIPVDDSSPMNVSTLVRECVQKLPGIPLSFNIKLTVILLCVFPCVSYFQVVLYPTLKEMYFNECRNKQVAVEVFFGLPPAVAPISFWPSLLFFILILFLALPALFSKPEDFVLPEGLECLYCKKYSEEHDNAFSFSDRRSVGDEILRHLKIMYHAPAKDFVTVTSLLRYCCKMWQKSRLSRVICERNSRRSRAIRVVLSLIGISLGIPLIALLAVSGLLLFLCFYGVSYSPFMTLVDCCKMKLFSRQISNNSSNRCIFFVVSLLCFGGIFWQLLNSFYFFIHVLGFTILGLTLNISIVTPYVVFVLALTTYLYLCYDNTQNKYKAVKKIISERREELHMIRNAPQGIISAKLYWFVCERVLPHEYEFLRMLFNMVCVSVYFF
ncbi:uncharacterized protein LOC141886227 [Acropora palmata]|uniref:uncharacterized protein LOC141886227 n=1 Tax=Acropora palmata TaxID=6131 RepID=UPI003D9FDB9C